MELDRAWIKRVLAQEDEVLRARAEQVLLLLGVEEKKRRLLLSDLSVLREKAQTITERDIERVQDALGQEAMQALAQLLGGNDG